MPLACIIIRVFKGSIDGRRRVHNKPSSLNRAESGACGMVSFEVASYTKPILVYDYDRNCSHSVTARQLQPVLLAVMGTHRWPPDLLPLAKDAGGKPIDGFKIHDVGYE